MLARPSFRWLERIRVREHRRGLLCWPPIAIERGARAEPSPLGCNRIEHEWLGRVAPAIPAVPAHLVSVVLQAGPARDALTGHVGHDRGDDGRFGDCWFAPSTAAPFDALEEGEDDEQRYDADYDRNGDRDL